MDFQATTKKKSGGTRKSRLLPETVKIGPAMYSVDVRDMSGENAVGRCNRDRDRLEIDEDLGRSATVVTFWHEVFHAMLMACGIVNDHDEIIIEALANQMALLLQQNPGIEKVS